MINQKKILDQIEYEYTNYVYAYKLAMFLKGKKIKEDVPEFDIDFIEMQVKILESLLTEKIKNNLKELAVAHAKIDIQTIKETFKNLKWLFIIYNSDTMEEKNEYIGFYKTKRGNIIHLMWSKENKELLEI